MRSKRVGMTASTRKGSPPTPSGQSFVGSAPGGFAVTERTEGSKIRDAAGNAAEVPTIAASKDDATDVEARHGFAVLGMKGAKIKLYDPTMLRRATLSLDVFKKNFLAVLFGTP
jgi:hypothetical protein